MIFFRTAVCVVLFNLILFGSAAQETNREVLQFNQSTYQGARQNWCVSAGKNGNIYFANHTGLLEFDGTNWTLNKVPNQTIMRSVKVGRDSLIYTGGFMELGYWKQDNKGILTYHSLSGKAQHLFTNNIEFWNIAVEPGYTYFQSFNKILAYHNDSI